MDRIYLTQYEKRALMLAFKQFNGMPNDIPQDKYSSAVRSLKKKGLVNAIFRKTGGVSKVWLSDDGKDYICDNPKLANPINWVLILSVIVTIVSLVTIALIIIR